MPRLVLASRSPQRRAILAALGIEFDVRATDVDELTAGEPRAVALENARRKAAAAAGQLVLGVDTVVTFDGRLYGKPDDVAAARATLTALAGVTHTVISGIWLTGAEIDDRSVAVETAVTFRPLDAATLEWYLDGNEWRDRAGGYAIQGRGGALVERIDGDFLNVVGLPVGALLDLCPGLLSGRD